MDQQGVRPARGAGGAGSASRLAERSAALGFGGAERGPTVAGAAVRGRVWTGC